MIYSNSKLILKVKCFVVFEKPFECLTNISIAIDVWSRYDVLNGIDKYIQRITVCFLYPNITKIVIIDSKTKISTVIFQR